MSCWRRQRRSIEGFSSDSMLCIHHLRADSGCQGFGLGVGSVWQDGDMEEVGEECSVCLASVTLRF